MRVLGLYRRRPTQSGLTKLGLSAKNLAIGAAAISAVVLTALAVYAVRPNGSVPAPDRSTAATSDTPIDSYRGPGTVATALQQDIVSALRTTAWPSLNPSMDSVINGPTVSPEVSDCGAPEFPNALACTWGPFAAPTRIILIGDAVGTGYAGPLRDIALNSDGQIQVHTESMPGCSFTDDLLAGADEALVAACPARKQHVIDVVKHWNPEIVLIAHAYGDRMMADTNRAVTPAQWSDSLRRAAEQIKDSVRKRIVFLAAPPVGIQIGDCYGVPANMPSDCVSQVSRQWQLLASAEQKAAAAVGGVWIDSRPWFCSGGKCPSFVGSTPTKRDAVFMAPPYGDQIYPVIKEALQTSGLL